MNETLKIENLTIAYTANPVLSNFSMHISKGESVAITGASGCGKSSLLKAILGIAPIRQGSITVGDTELSAENIVAFRRKTAYLPQELTFPYEWVSEMIAVTFRIKANIGKEDNNKLHTYLEQLGLDADICNKRFSEISGGQRQRVMIAVTALTGKDFILLDEPTSALDNDSVKRVISFLSNLEHKPGIIVVTHDNEFAGQCNRVINL